MSNSNLEEVIKKMISETNTGVLNWKIYDKIPDSLLSNEKLIGSVFYVDNLKGTDKHLRIYKYYKEKKKRNSPYLTFSELQEEFIESSKIFENIRLEFFINDRAIYKFPDSFLMDTLYEDIQMQVSGLESFIESYGNA